MSFNILQQIGPYLVLMFQVPEKGVRISVIEIDSLESEQELFGLLVKLVLTSKFVNFNDAYKQIKLGTSIEDVVKGIVNG